MEMTIKKIAIKNIAQERIKRGLTTQQLATKADLTHDQIKNIIYKGKLTFKTAEKLAEVFGWMPFELFIDDEAEYGSENGPF